MVVCQHFQITPINFSPDEPLHLEMKYKFNRSNTKWPRKVFRTGLDLVTNNNTWCGAGYFDGHTIDIFAKPGELMRVEVEAEKYIFKKNHGKCRQQPYNELLFKKISEDINRCPKPCRPTDYWLCKYMMEAIGHLPICPNRSVEQCFKEVQKEAQKEIIEKPCTKVQFKYESSVWQVKNHLAEYWVDFSHPQKVRVKEEYLIYDLVSMVGAIGGTMGLCIGFSFREFSGYLLKRCEKLLARMSQKRKRDK